MRNPVEGKRSRSGGGCVWYERGIEVWRLMRRAKDGDERKRCGGNEEEALLKRHLLFSNKY